MTEAVGTLAEEAAKLLGAAETWWRQHAPETGPAECRYCPFCQALSVVRGAQPEVFERFSEAAASLLATLRATGEQAPPRDEPPVEHIDIA